MDQAKLSMRAPTSRSSAHYLGGGWCPKQIKREMTDANKDAVIAAKNKRIKDLEDENKRLKQELQMLRGKLYESRG